LTIPKISIGDDVEKREQLHSTGRMKIHPEIMRSRMEGDFSIY
jgi:hypothetical protein